MHGCRGVQNTPDDPEFTRPCNRTRFNLTSRMIYNYVKNYIDTKPDFRPTGNTLLEINPMTRMNTVGCLCEYLAQFFTFKVLFYLFILEFFHVYVE